MSFSATINNKEKYPSISLKDEISECEVEIYSFGALLNSFSVALNGSMINIVDGFQSSIDAEQNISNGFKSAKLSPFVCRMNKGEYNFGNVNYKIEKFYLPPHAIHGLIYDAVYEILTINADENSASVTLAYEYSCNDNGYPFNYYSEVIWTLSANYNLSVTTKVINKTAHSIPFADGWHPYFTLGTTVDECSLQFDSNTMIEFDETLIPTGNKVDDNRFVNGVLLKDIFLDNCFELNKNGACVLQNNKLKLSILPDATYPFLQVYTPPHRNSIAIENLSATPDAFNNKMGLLLIEPNKEYLFTTTYQITTK